MKFKKEPASWITVKGNHIPIMKGQSKKDAVSLFFKEKSPEIKKDNSLTNGAGSENDKPINTGAKSGALDPESIEAKKHAIQMYTQISRRTQDVYKIAKITGHKSEDIKKVKEYIFVATKTGYYTTKYGDVFFVSYEQAESWRRLTEGKPEAHDLTFIKHELLELSLREKGLSYDEAHKIATKKYNYQLESKEYTKRLKEYGRIKIRKKDKR